jgi:hypothetical protein
MPQPNSIFISYRRADSQDLTGRIYEYLAKHFGTEVVFRDVYSLPMGEDYRTHLREKAQNCQAMVVVMGPDWVTVEDKDGNRRLDNPDDWVRVEVETGLKREITVIPLLIDGARIPKEEDLPGDLKPLAYRKAALARPDPDFQHDMERLIRQLEKVVNKTDGRPKLRRSQQLKLDYAKTKLEDLEKQLLRVQKELAANTDVVTVSKLETRQLQLLDDIDTVYEEIQQLESGNG